MGKGRVSHLPLQFLGMKENITLWIDISAWWITRKRTMPNDPSAKNKINHGPDFSVPWWDGNRIYSSDSENCDMSFSGVWFLKARRARKASPHDKNIIQRLDTRLDPFTSQWETSVGTRNNVLLISRLWERIKIVFTFQDKSSLVYCNIISGLINSVVLKYDATEWRLLIESFSRSLKAVLLHNGKSLLSFFIGNSVQMKETPKSNDLLSAVNCQEQK